MARTKTAAKPAAKKTTTKKTAKKAAPKKATAKKATPASKAKAASKKGEEEVTLDRRRGEQRSESESEAAEAPKLERREKVNRRRQIDPTTCERDYSDQEVEFMSALDAYKRRSGRMFPTCSEVLEVIRELGYTQLSAVELAMVREQRGETAESDAEQEAAEALAESEELRVD